MNQLLETYTWSRRATSQSGECTPLHLHSQISKQSTLNLNGIFKSSHRHLVGGVLLSDKKRMFEGKVVEVDGSFLVELAGLCVLKSIFDFS